jgi:glycosyltransferase involved in cell wall biosynthesis
MRHIMKFSVVTPSLNQAQFLRETIESIWTQRGNFEIEHIIMDGGSTDDSVKVIQEYEARLRSGQYEGYCNGIRLIWQSQKDGGQSDAINRGMRLATGDIRAYLNADDLYLPGALQAVQQVFVRFPHLMWAYGRCLIINEAGVEVQRPIRWYKTLLGRIYSYATLLVLNFIPQPATFWRASVTQQVGLFREDEHLCMDYEYWCRLGKHFPAKQIPRILASFRVHSGSKGGTKFRQQFTDERRVAAVYTKNRFLLWLHTLHGRCIVFIYARMRSNS